MNSTALLKKIRKDLHSFSKYDVVIFGSIAQGTGTHRSDIDIAVITRETDREKQTALWKRLLSKAPQCYHLNIFELLPLHIKAEIIENHRVVYGDASEIHEYFYHFRKLWKDTKGRYYANQFSSFKEKMEKMDHQNNSY